MAKSVRKGASYVYTGGPHLNPSYAPLFGEIVEVINLPGSGYTAGPIRYVQGDQGIIYSVSIEHLAPLREYKKYLGSF